MWYLHTLVEWFFTYCRTKNYNYWENRFETTLFPIYSALQGLYAVSEDECVLQNSEQTFIYLSTQHHSIATITIPLFSKVRRMVIQIFRKLFQLGIITVQSLPKWVNGFATSLHISVLCVLQSLSQIYGVTVHCRLRGAKQRCISKQVYHSLVCHRLAKGEWPGFFDRGRNRTQGRPHTTASLAQFSSRKIVLSLGRTTNHYLIGFVLLIYMKHFTIPKWIYLPINWYK